MNGKKARSLRKAAQQATIGQKNVDYDYGRPPEYLVQRSNFGIIISIKKTLAGIPRKLIKGCTRQVYQELKRA